MNLYYLTQLKNPGSMSLPGFLQSENKSDQYDGWF